MKLQIWKVADGGIRRSVKTYDNYEAFVTQYEKYPKNKKFGYFEMIEGPQKLYMDIDAVPDAQEDNYEDWLKHVEDQCCIICEHIKETNDVLAKVLFFDQSKENKFSGHIIVSNYYTEDHIQGKRFFEACKKIFGSDPNVYHKVQMLRIRDSFKADQDSVQKKLLFTYDLEFGANYKFLDDISLSNGLVSYTQDCYLYSNKNKKLDLPRDVKPWNSNQRNDTYKLLLDIPKLIMMSKKIQIQYDIVDPNKISLSDHVKFETGYFLPITYDEKELVCAIGKRKFKKFETNDKFKKSGVAINLETDDPIIATIDVVIDKVRELMQSGKYNELVPDISTKISDFPKPTCFNSKTKFIFPNYSKDTSVVGVDGRRCEFSKLTESGYAYFGVIIKGCFISEKYFSISLGLKQIVVEENKEVSPIILDMSKLKV